MALEQSRRQIWRGKICLSRLSCLDTEPDQSNLRVHLVPSSRYRPSWRGHHGHGAWGSWSHCIKWENRVDAVAWLADQDLSPQESFQPVNLIQKPHHRDTQVFVSIVTLNLVMLTIKINYWKNLTWAMWLQEGPFERSGWVRSMVFSHDILVFQKQQELEWRLGHFCHILFTLWGRGTCCNV